MQIVLQRATARAMAQVIAKAIMVKANLKVLKYIKMPD
jgi:hypothetical protein